MSNSKKNQTKQDWRAMIKDLLVMECKSTKSDTPMVTKKSRFSLDIDQEFKEKLKIRELKLLDINETEEEIGTHLIKNPNIPLKQKPNQTEEKTKCVKFTNDDSVYDEMTHWQNSSDDSFEAIEQMCNKTGSDPNNTLFQYLHSENKTQIIADVKKNMSDRSFTKLTSNCEEKIVPPIDVELSNPNIATSAVKIKALVNEPNYTLLEDTEAPTQFWDKTISNESMLPETAMEMLSISYPRRKNSVGSSISTSCYEKGAETIGIESDIGISSISSISVDAKTVANDLTSKTDDHEDTVSQSVYITEIRPGFHNVPHSSITIEPYYTELCKMENEHIIYKSNKQYNIDDSVIVLSDDSNDSKETVLEHVHKKRAEKFIDFVNPNSDFSDKENQENFVNSKCLSPSENKLLKPNEVHTDKIKRNTFTISPKKKAQTSPKLSKLGHGVNRNVKLTLNESSKTETKKTAASTNSMPENPFALNMKMRKLDVFKIPKSSESSASKLSARKKFEHIISPIGTYIKKGATTPLMTTHKPYKIHKYPACRQLEYESDLNIPHFQKSESDKLETYDFPTVPRKLPKKAYISSEIKHFVDERTQVTIPEVNKIKKYILTATLPVVLRHDGKYKLPADNDKLVNVTHSTARIPKAPFQKKNINDVLVQKNRVIDASLQDFSIISGDVSLYTIKDAHKL